MVTQYFINYRLLKTYLKKKTSKILLPQKSVFQLEKDQYKCPSTQNHAIKIIEKKNNTGQCFVSFRNIKNNKAFFSVIRF